MAYTIFVGREMPGETLREGGAMSLFHFGCGSGRISQREISRRSKIARKHGVTFHVVTGNSGHCQCGWGCRIDRCPIKRWWYSCPNLGAPFDDAVARAVESEVGASAAV